MSQSISIPSQSQQYPNPPKGFVPSITIYVDWASQPCRAIKRVCDLFNIADYFNWALISLLKGDQFKPDFLRINPNHTAPCLIDNSNGLKLFESTAIIEYIDQLYPLDGPFGLPKVTLSSSSSTSTNNLTNPTSQSQSDSILQRFQAINALHNYHNAIRPITKILLQSWFISVFGQKKGLKFNTQQFEKNVNFVKKNHFKMLNLQLKQNNGYLSQSQSPTIADIFAFMELWQFVKWDYDDGDMNTFHMYDYPTEEFPEIHNYLKKLQPILYNYELWSGARAFIGYGRSISPESAVLNGAKGSVEQRQQQQEQIQQQQASQQKAQKQQAKL